MIIKEIWFNNETENLQMICTSGFNKYIRDKNKISCINRENDMEIIIYEIDLKGEESDNILESVFIMNDKGQTIERLI